MTRARKHREPWADAIAHLRRVDPYCAAVIDQVGPCRLEPAADRFGTLVRAIISQQISSKAAAAIEGRLRAIGGAPHAPAVLLSLGDEALRGVGLSRVKARYVLNLAEAVASRQAPLDEFDDWDDDAIIGRLTAIKGIGRWTADMFLIFALNRPDVLPVGDLGVRAALRDRHGLAELPGPSECAVLAELWRPYRSIAIWYLWRRTSG
jgi:3-methyladenine DNA glycosylase/8-oxoguanine DNA glycosylase